MAGPGSPACIPVGDRDTTHVQGQRARTAWPGRARQTGAAGTGSTDVKVSLREQSAEGYAAHAMAEAGGAMPPFWQGERRGERQAARGGAQASAAAARPSAYERYGKRLFDLAFALLLLPLVAPVIAALWAVTKLDGGPGFFGHQRVGRHGRRFRCWKLRSMVPDAEARLQAYLAANPDAAAEFARDFKLRHDPRITRFGRFIRRTSLDELPQIWNVLTGEMSLVGPRPVVPAELSRYGAQQWAYTRMRPGITGIWQVSGRNEVSYGERVRMDASYPSRASLGFDLRVLAMTVRAVLGSTGR